MQKVPRTCVSDLLRVGQPRRRVLADHVVRASQDAIRPSAQPPDLIRAALGKPDVATVVRREDGVGVLLLKWRHRRHGAEAADAVPIGDLPVGEDVIICSLDAVGAGIDSDHDVEPFTTQGGVGTPRVVDRDPGRAGPQAPDPPVNGRHEPRGLRCRRVHSDKVAVCGQSDEDIAGSLIDLHAKGPGVRWSRAARGPKGPEPVGPGEVHVERMLLQPRDPDVAWSEGDVAKCEAGRGLHRTCQVDVHAAREPHRLAVQREETAVRVPVREARGPHGMVVPSVGGHDRGEAGPVTGQPSRILERLARSRP